MPKTRNKDIEDDCGTDLTRLAPHWFTVGADDSTLDYDVDELMGDRISSSSTWRPLGSSAPARLGNQGERVMLATMVHQLL